MTQRIFTILLIIAIFTLKAKPQCSYDLIKVSNIDCYGENVGEIQVSIPNASTSIDPSFWWTGPNGFSAGEVLSLSNLSAGDYILHIEENMIAGDTSSSEICSSSHIISVFQTVDITAEFTVDNICSLTDSADVYTKIYGGTGPYTTLWNPIGDTSRNIINVPPSLYTLYIIDANGCQKDTLLLINGIKNMQSFMSQEDVICKDDNSGLARIYIENGTPPFNFTWNTGETFTNQSASQINNLFPGVYTVVAEDMMGCIIFDTIEISSNPEICIKIYKVFSPNEDGIHDFWEIKNIHLYPEALVEVYDRLGNRVFRRKNYINSSLIAFSGIRDNKRLPSGTYYYIINLENGDEVFKGALTIVR